MELLFALDSHNYGETISVIERFAVRGLICKNGLWAMQKAKTGEYKIPGGGIEQGESHSEALQREVLEETGLHVIENTIREIGEVLEIRRDNFNHSQKYIAHSYCYFCVVDDIVSDTSMTENELKHGYELAWASLEDIISTNERICIEDWQKRDLLILKWIKNHLNNSDSVSHV